MNEQGLRESRRSRLTFLSVSKGQAVLMLPYLGHHLGLSEDILNSVVHFRFKVA